MSPVGGSLFRIVKDMSSMAITCRLYIVVRPMKIGLWEESDICADRFDVV